MNNVWNLLKFGLVPILCVCVGGWFWRWALHPQEIQLEKRVFQQGAFCTTYTHIFIILGSYPCRVWNSNLIYNDPWLMGFVCCRFCLICYWIWGVTIVPAHPPARPPPYMQYLSSGACNWTYGAHCVTILMQRAMLLWLYILFLWF